MAKYGGIFSLENQFKLMLNLKFSRTIYSFYLKSIILHITRLEFRSFFNAFRQDKYYSDLAREQTKSTHIFVGVEFTF